MVAWKRGFQVCYVTSIDKNFPLISCFRQNSLVHYIYNESCELGSKIIPCLERIAPGFSPAISKIHDRPVTNAWVLDV